MMVHVSNSWFLIRDLLTINDREVIPEGNRA